MNNKLKLIPHVEKTDNNEVILSKEIKSSSSDNIYTVTLYKDKISCTCPAGGKKTLCKHMTSVLNENIDMIKTTNIDFYNNIQIIIDLKNNHKTKSEEYKKIANEVIYVNRSIAETAHNNSVNIKNYNSYSFETIIDNIENNFSDEQKEILLSILKEIKPHLFKTIVYLSRRLGEKKKDFYFDPDSDDYKELEREYIAGGKLVDNLLIKYSNKGNK